MSESTFKRYLLRSDTECHGIKSYGPFYPGKTVDLYNGTQIVITSEMTVVGSIEIVGSYEKVFCSIDGDECLNCASYGDWKYNSSLKKWVCVKRCQNCVPVKA